jgi:nucleoid-associated protein YgaU
MTKETKIGLLVGLAFIILFAIILSEKGTTPRDTRAPVFSRNLGTGPAIASADPQRPLNDAGKLPLDGQLPPIVSPGGLADSGGTQQSLEGREEEVVLASPEQELPRSLPDSIAGLLGPEEAATGNPPESYVSVGPSPALGEGAFPAAPELSAPSQATPQQPASPPEGPALFAATEQTRREATSTGRKSPPRPLVEHVVQPGESISKVAALHYGRSTPERINAIREANRDRVKDIGSVRVGTRLIIPDLGEAASAFEPAPAFAAANLEAPPSPPENRIRIPLPIKNENETSLHRADAGRAIQPDSVRLSSIKPESDKASRFQWYQVRKKDTLAGIARRELGSERRLTDIFQLNRDILRDKNTLKPGMKLRVPLRTSATMEASTILSSRAMHDHEP